ncbi:MAG: hypothetical protein AUJ00_00385 [Gemmatimonadetes bacterium 13_1_40CM_3_70_6]|nr:MAG: hypothetical protein AUJ00_00385 [Gemmatimonadetes bacterium 13_1_40CM_3_70_6]
MGQQVLRRVVAENPRERRIAGEEPTVEGYGADAGEVVLEQPAVALFRAAALSEGRVELPTDALGDAADQERDRRGGDDRQPRGEQHPVGTGQRADPGLDEPGCHHDHDRRRQKRPEQPRAGRLASQVAERPGVRTSHRQHRRPDEQEAQARRQRDRDGGGAVQQRGAVSIPQRHDGSSERRQGGERGGRGAYRRAFESEQHQREGEEQDRGGGNGRHDAERHAAQRRGRHADGGIGIERRAGEPGRQRERCE